MKSALPGVILVVAGALITYWALTSLGLFTPKIGGTGVPGASLPPITPVKNHPGRGGQSG